MPKEYLNVSEKFQDSDWEDTDFSPVKEGKHRVIISKIDGEEHSFSDYDGYLAALEMQVCDEDDADFGKKIFDRINLPHEKEKGGNRKRRAAILKKLGFVSSGESNEIKFNWDRLEGLECIVEVEHNKGVDKNGKERTYANVLFAGYERVENGTEAASTEEANADDDFGDI